MKSAKSLFVIVLVAMSVSFAKSEVVTGTNSVVFNPNAVPNQANTITSNPSRIQFKVKIDNLEFGFQEMNGLVDQQNNSNQKTQNKSMPGIKKNSTATLKKGVFQGDKNTFDKFSNSLKSTPQKTTITISMLDETGKVVKNWTLTNAFTLKVVASTKKPSNNEIAIESMDIAFESLK